MRHHGHREEMSGLVRGFRGHQSEHFHRFRIKSSGRIHAVSVRSVPATTRSDPDALPTSFEEAEHGLRGTWHRLDAVAATPSERPRHRPKNHPLHQKTETTRVDGVKRQTDTDARQSSSSRCGAFFWISLPAGCRCASYYKYKVGCGPWRRARRPRPSSRGRRRP